MLLRKVNLERMSEFKSIAFPPENYVFWRVVVIVFLVGIDIIPSCK